MKISFIIPVYNCERYLTECLESIIGQRTDSVEIILVNDGSTDDSLYICNAYAKRYDMITVINQPNRGTSSARNAGLEVATGKFIWFVDSDDMIADDVIPTIIDTITDDVDILTFNYTSREDCGDFVHYVYDNRQKLTPIEFLSQSKRGYLWNKILKRETIGTTRFLDGTKNIEDFLFCLQVITKCTSILTLPIVGYIYNCTNQFSTLRNRDWSNLLKLSEDSLTVHFELQKFIGQSDAKYAPILTDLLNISIAGHLHSLLIDYNWDILSDSINRYKSANLYPIKKTSNKKANIFIMTVNNKSLVHLISIFYAHKNKRKVH